MASLYVRAVSDGVSVSRVIVQPSASMYGPQLAAEADLPRYYELMVGRTRLWTAEGGWTWRG